MEQHYVEEQQSELEVLASIFPAELEVIDETPPCRLRVRITVEAREALPSRIAGADRDYKGEPTAAIIAARHSDAVLPRLDDVLVYMAVGFVPTYPDTVPDIELVVESTSGAVLTPLDVTEESTCITWKDIQAATTAVQAAAQDNVGMAMVFSLAAAAKEVLEQRIVARIVELETRTAHEIAAAEQREAQRLSGTKVNAESFAEWRVRFLAEIKQLLADSQGKDPRQVLSSAQYSAAVIAGMVSVLPVGPNGKPRLTGKQLFEQDKTMVQSDMQFLGDGDVTVDVEQLVALRIDGDSKDRDDTQDDGQGLTFADSSDDDA